MEWKSNLGAFMQKHEHYSVKEINNIIINPLLESLIKEFIRYDDFLPESFVTKDEEKDINYNHFVVKPNCYPKYFQFMVIIWFEKGKLFIENNSKDVFNNLSEVFNLRTTPNIVEEFTIEDAFKIDYLATVITRMFINYYELTCKQNKFTHLEIQKGSFGC